MCTVCPEVDQPGTHPGNSDAPWGGLHFTMLCKTLISRLEGGLTLSDWVILAGGCQA